MNPLSFPGSPRSWLASLLLVVWLGCGGGSGGGGDDPRGLTVAITHPTQKTFVRTSVTVQVVVEGGSADSVELLRDGAILSSLVAPYQYTWDTSPVPEGTYALTARATRGGTSVTSSPLEVVVDRTPPSLESRWPQSGLSTDWDGVISFTASEPLAASTVNGGSVRLLEDGVEIRRKLHLSNDGKTVSVAIDQPLTLPSSMSVQLVPGITDLAGNLLTLPVDDWRWLAVQWRLLGKAVTQPGHGASLQHTSMVVDGEGRLVVAFEEVADVPVGTPTTGRLVVARWTPSGWERISPPDASGQGRLAVDGAGRLHLAWAPALGLSVSRWDGQRWTPVVAPVTRERGTVDRGMRLALTPQGAPMVAWHSQDEAQQQETGHVYVRESDAFLPRYSWGPARIQALAMYGEGFPWVVHTSAGPTPRTQVATWNGTGFSDIGGSLEGAAATSSHARAADLAFDGAGRTYVAWRSQDRIYLQRWDGGRWENLGSVEALGDSSSDEQLALEVTAAGTVYVAWTYRPHPQMSEVRVDRWNGTAFEPVLSGIRSDVFGGVSLVLDAMGLPVVAWLAPAPSGSHRPIIQVRANH